MLQASIQCLQLLLNSFHRAHHLLNLSLLSHIPQYSKARDMAATTRAMCQSNLMEATTKGDTTSIRAMDTPTKDMVKQDTTLTTRELPATTTLEGIRETITILVTTMLNQCITTREAHSMDQETTTHSNKSPNKLSSQSHNHNHTILPMPPPTTLRLLLSIQSQLQLTMVVNSRTLTSQRTLTTLQPQMATTHQVEAASTIGKLQLTSTQT